MLPLGLSTSERAAFEATLRTSYERRIQILILDMAQNVLSTVSHRLLDGQVVVDADADVTRSASLTLLDPTHTLNFDTDSPDDGALFLDRMVRINYCVHVPALARWVEVPVFTGPVTSLERDGAQVQIEAQGKESIARQAVWNPYTKPKGAVVVDVIKDLMQRRAGENRFDLPTGTARLTKPVTLPREAIVWDEAKKLASYRGLWYDGRGWLRMQDTSASPVFTFKTGDGGLVLTRPKVSFSTDDVKNVVSVTGGIPKGSKTAVRAVAHAPTTHPLNHGRLGRNGVPRYMVEFVEDDTLTTTAQAQARADAILAPLLLETVQVQFDSMPVPHLEPHDVVSLRTDNFSANFRLRQFTIPLVTGSPMPVGYVRKLTPKRRSRTR